MTARPIQERNHDSGAQSDSSIAHERLSRWSSIAERTVYFAHRSVGAGVVAGVAGIVHEYSLPLQIVQTREPAEETGPAFVHFIVGWSGDYTSKNAAVLRLLEARTRAKNPVIVLKYCYGDIRRPSDPGAMFAAYCDTIETIQSDHPDASIVHTTLPLTTITRSSDWAASQMFGRQTQRGAALARHRYNELVRAEFGAGGAILDIARVESTKPDGQLSGFPSGGCLIETLASENTYDGVHLNARCERVAAETLLDALADVMAVR